MLSLMLSSLLERVNYWRNSRSAYDIIICRRRIHWYSKTPDNTRRRFHWKSPWCQLMLRLKTWNLHPRLQGVSGLPDRYLDWDSGDISYVIFKAHFDRFVETVCDFVEHSLQWRHNEHDDISNHQPHDCLLNRLFRRRSKKTSKLRVTGLCAGNSPVTGEFPDQRASHAQNVSIWWRHHVLFISQQRHTRLSIYKRRVINLTLECQGWPLIRMYISQQCWRV